MGDVREMRRDPAVFAAVARGGRLIDWQEHELRAAAAGTVTCWLHGRQLGKSERLADLALWAAFRAAGRRVLVVSGGGQLGARRLLESARRVAAASPLLAGSVVDEGAAVLRLSNGSEVRSVPASEHAVRGWSVDALLVDEAQLVSDELLLGAALPTVSARPGAFVVLAGTAGRAAGAFYDLCRRGEVGAEHVRFSRRVSRLVGGSDAAPWQSPSLIEAQVQAMGPTRADAEHRCLWVSGADYLLSRADLEAVTADYQADELGTLGGPAGVFAGLDLGLSSDRSALVAVGRLVLAEAWPPVFGVRCAHAWPAGHPIMAPDGGPAAGVFEELAASPAVLESLRVDATGMQGGFLQYLLPLLRRRPVELGGGRPASGSVLLEERPDGRLVPLVLRGGELVPARPGAGAGAEARPEMLGVAAARPAMARATDVRGVAFSGAMKQAAYGALRLLVQRGQLVLPASATELRAELLTLRVGLAASGRETFDAESGAHDDLPDALVLALRPYRRRDGQWRTVVGDLAERPVAPLERPRGLWAGGRVQTGGGLVVPAVPGWASMVGPGVTLPPAQGVAPVVSPGLVEAAARIGAVLDAIDRKEARDGA